MQFLSDGERCEYAAQKEMELADAMKRLAQAVAECDAEFIRHYGELVGVLAEQLADVTE